MSLIGASSKAGYMFGRNLPKIVKAMSAPHHVSIAKIATVAGHTAIVTAKIAGAGIIGLISASWIGF